MLGSFIGKKSEKVKNIIERGAVKKFAEAIGDPSPIYIDEQVGKSSPYKQNLAPPTFPATFDRGSIPGLPSKGLLHGEQIYQYTRPLLVGEEVFCWNEVKNYYEKEGKSGKMGFLVLTLHGEDVTGKLLFTEERIAIINDAVRKEMNA
ncbi:MULTISPECIES: MaoC family dehydratase N-terminal domain-containing protein [unclassified Sporosarcina]|uniref:MaoC family dehydratase N-terminal domain-containing protein n=1 Tax=unclassified Sporosarcina TaxID=2647733 RepID=UPI00203CF07B|nr:MULTISPECIES: MaoC family dehydratase N-terminal domain-containing protein [unclassified Sporosarcina]GKV65218.1 hypothetical protein NCCP2331_13710 [Sporosarcina sp. NCCP-2331]GLB55342.1 hypothetical protein NCCP2378_11280 [Sporosarcina sp. NCCP-2378]